MRTRAGERRRRCSNETRPGRIVQKSPGLILRRRRGAGRGYRGPWRDQRREDHGILPVPAPLGMPSGSGREYDGEGGLICQGRLCLNRKRQRHHRFRSRTRLCLRAGQAGGHAGRLPGQKAADRAIYGAARPLSGGAAVDEARKRAWERSGHDGIIVPELRWNAV